jgi:hypothetical protein
MTALLLNRLHTAAGRQRHTLQRVRLRLDTAGGEVGRIKSCELLLSDLNRLI